MKKLVLSRQTSKYILHMQRLCWQRCSDRHTEHVLVMKKLPTISSFEITKTTRSSVFAVVNLL